MRILCALAFFWVLASASPSWASSGSGEAPSAGQGFDEGEERRAPGTPGAPMVSLRGLVSPVIVNGELFRYVYFSVKLKLYDVNQKALMLKKIPYLQDAFLREVHGASIAFNNDPNIVDEAGLKARLMRICEEMVGAGVVKAIELVDASPAASHSTPAPAEAAEAPAAAHTAPQH